MTADSEPLPAAAAPATGPAARAEAPVLARGHLHPAILLLRLLDALRQAVFPALLGVIVEPWFLALAGFLFLLQLGYALARYLSLEYVLTAGELRVREGILQRQERRIPLDRIQDIGFESTILRRALGLTVVLVETASGTGVEARLDALSRADADHLREVLLAARRQIQAQEDARSAQRQAEAAALAGTAPPPVTPPMPEREWLVHKSSTTELLMRGLTDLRLSAFAVTGFAAFEFADRLGLIGQLAGVARGVRDWLAQFGPVAFGLVLTLVLFLVIAFGVVTATLGNLVQFHGFELTLRGSVLQRRYGLLTTRQKTLPRDRIQRVTIEQPWLRRLLGYGVVKADSAGGSRAQGEDTTGGWDVVVPLLKLPAAFALLPALLPGLDRAELRWQNGSPKLVARTAFQGALLGAALTAAIWPAAGPYAAFALLTIPVWALLGVLVYRNLAYALGGEFLVLQHGIVGRYLAY
ncbi:MAG: PH domain-containing protein, partial [Planctomycetes bacterium]|nr:PH domain-containing protein [Planctomycetota bacterium]